MGFELRGSVSLDGSGFQSGLDKIQAGVSHLKSAILSAFGAAAIEQAVHRTVDYAASIAEAADRIGMSTDALQKFAFAARMTGSDLERLVLFVEKLNASRVDPKKWGGYAKLGINDPLSGDAGQLLFSLNAQMRGRNPQELYGPLKEIAPKSGAMMNFLRSDLVALTEEADKLHQVLDKETIKQLKLVDEVFKSIGTGIKVFLGPVLIWLGGQIAILANGIRGTFVGLQTFINSDPRIRKAIDPSIRAAFSTEKWESMFSLFADVMKTKNDPKWKDRANDAFLAGMGKFITEQDKWEKFLKSLGLPEPPPPNFAAVVGKPKGHRVGDASDSLTRVGNFLGASQDVLQSIGERQIQLLQKIANNTERVGPGGGYADPDFGD